MAAIDLDFRRAMVARAETYVGRDFLGDDQTIVALPERELMQRAVDAGLTIRVWDERGHHRVIPGRKGDAA